MAAAYRIGPSDFFLPTDLKADADTLDSQVQALDANVEGHDGVDPNWLDQWMTFQGQWAAFYNNQFGGLVSEIVSALNDSNRDQLISYENQFQSLYAKGSSSGVPALANVVQPSTGSGDTLANQLKPLLDALPSGTTVVGVIILVIVLLVVWKA